MITIAVVNSKGGSGKTTLSSALGVRAAKDGRVALLDLDPQRSLVEWWRRRGASENPTIFEGVDEAADAVERADLAGYDWLILDSPPAFLQVIQDAVHAADFAIIPIRPSMIDLTATQDTIAIARDAGTAFLCVLNDAIRGEKILDSAREFLSKFAVPTAATTVFHRVSHIRGMAVGKSGPEVNNGKDTAAAKEIDDLWQEVNAAATKAARARARRKAAADV
jgi:chromosome partitioning protein